MRTIGVDLGDKWSHVVVLDHATGAKLGEKRVRSRREAFAKFLGRMPRSRVALEAGTHSRWVSVVLEELGHEVIVANPRQVALISRSDRKNDRRDAELLAMLARTEPRLLSPIKHRGPKAQADLALIRSRDALVKTRTLLVNHVRGTVKAFGHRLPGCSTQVFHKLDLEEFPEEIRPVLEPLLAQIGAMTAAIKAYNKQVELVAKESYPETEVLKQVGGVGALTSLAFVLTLEEPGRFPSGRMVGSYLGLVPRQRDSGDCQPQLRITKAGNGYLRQLLVGSAQYVLGPFGPDCDLRRWGTKLASRGGKAAKRRAVVAVARKLAVLLLKLWRTGEEYQPLRNSRRRGKARGLVVAEVAR
jgi:transposase